ncbi:MAG TPA: IniB N-terminal domain-containing protein [Actinophytocola sp.]|uniref:IniB N-terminal domain-containing protein n=1 Tax=Actinophytocola sp. TaxID=1872138 RepID=UPI002E091AAD|nr:IniB N-terminal domain-containing protein [Actinophytocola sp.]
MSSLSALIDFLVSLMRDDDARAEFDEDPQAALARGGLGDVTGQDVRDARMVMRDSGCLVPAGGSHGARHSGSHDPVREIHHTTANYHVDANYQRVDQTFNLVNIDDRDTTVIDSFNSNNNNNNDTDVVAIQDNSQETNTNIDIDDSFNREPENPPAPAPDEDEPVAQEPDPIEEPAGDEPVTVEPVPAESVVEEHLHEEPEVEVDHDPVDAAVI